MFVCGCWFFRQCEVGTSTAGQMQPCLRVFEWAIQEPIDRSKFLGRGRLLGLFGDGLQGRLRPLSAVGGIRLGVYAE